MDDSKQTISAEVKTVSVEVPVRLRMQSVQHAPFDFETAIDDVGQIILTPTSLDMEFISANTDANVEYEIPVKEQPTTIQTDDSLTIKDTSIILQTTMLCEDDNLLVSADVDNIGRCVIYPMSKKNTFLSVTTGDSLNLITEDTAAEEYCGYRLVNNGDGWDVFDPTGDLVEEGIATINEAKILICKTELGKLENTITEAVTVDTEASEEASEEPVTPEVTADVIEEAVNSFVKTAVIDRFMRAEVPLFSDNGTPLESYVHLEELDSNGYEYYYDPESDAIVSYFMR